MSGCCQNYRKITRSRWSF